MSGLRSWKGKTRGSSISPLFDDVADRERKWGAFVKDLDWLALEAESESRTAKIVAGVTYTHMGPGLVLTAQVAEQ